MTTRMKSATTQLSLIQGICPDRSEEIRPRHFRVPGHFVLSDRDVFFQRAFSDRYHTRPVTVIFF